MSFEKYKQALLKLPIKNPTLTDMTLLCPHLDPVQIAFLMKGEKAWAGPPTLVNDSFLHMAYITRDVDRQLLVTPHVKLVCSTLLNDKVEQQLPFVDMAIEYARQNWGYRLIKPTWKEVISLRDGSRVVNIALSQSWEQLLRLGDIYQQVVVHMLYKNRSDRIENRELFHYNRYSVRSIETYPQLARLLED
jgi:hypothetical protein